MVINKNEYCLNCGCSVKTATIKRNREKELHQIQIALLLIEKGITANF
jgi:hypothetical protein